MEVVGENDDDEECECGRGRGRESLAQAAAWLAPLPPGEMEKELDVRVSPGCGWRGTYETRSMLREPRTVILGGGMVIETVDDDDVVLLLEAVEFLLWGLTG